MKSICRSILAGLILLTLCNVAVAEQTRWQAKLVSGSLTIASVLTDNNVLLAMTCDGTLLFGTENARDPKIEIDGQEVVWVIARTGPAGVIFSSKSAGIRQLKKGHTVKFINSNGRTDQFVLTGFTRAFDNAC